MTPQNTQSPPIDSDIPVPAPAYDYAQALSAMTVGQSFAFPKCDKSAVRKAAALVRAEIRIELYEGRFRAWLLSVPGSISPSARSVRSDTYRQQLKEWAGRAERSDFKGTAYTLRSILPPRFGGGTKELGRVLAILAKIVGSGVTIASVDTKRGNVYHIDLISMRSSD